MTDTPMLFSAPMVRALLDGRKTQTRRVLAPANAQFGSAPRDYWVHCDLGRAWTDGAPESGMYLHVPCHERDDHSCTCPRCIDMGWEGTVHRLWPRLRPGDRIWVRETWGHDAPDLDTCRRGRESDGISYGPYYFADENWFDNRTIKKISPIHMPRWASRLTLTVTALRIERVKDISKDDAIAEGIARSPHGNRDQWCHYPLGTSAAGYRDPRGSYRSLWESLHGDGTWADNPWVLAYTFSVALEDRA